MMSVSRATIRHRRQLYLFLCVPQWLQCAIFPGILRHVQVPMPPLPRPRFRKGSCSQGIVVFCWYGYQPENQSALDTLLDVKRTG